MGTSRVSVGGSGGNRGENNSNVSSMRVKLSENKEGRAPIGWKRQQEWGYCPCCFLWIGSRGPGKTPYYLS